MKGISMNNIMSVINSGKIFTACYIKKDGSEIVMNCRVGVTKGVTGKGMKYDQYYYQMKNVHKQIKYRTQDMRRDFEDILY